MCHGKIERVWVQNEPIKAIKERTRYSWGVDLEYHKGGSWQYPRHRVISPGGGPGLSSDFFQVYSKSVSDYLGENICGVDCWIRPDAQLTGFHAWESYDKLYNAFRGGCTFSGGLACLRASLWIVELRGIIQRSGFGELIASEMRVLHPYESATI